MELDFNEVGNPVRFGESPAKVLPPPPAKSNALDLERPKRMLEPYRRVCIEEQRWANALVIETEEDLIEASERMLKNKKRFKAMEAKRMASTEEARGFTATANSLWKSVGDFLSCKAKTGAIEVSTAKIGAFQYQQELDRRVAAKKAQDEADKVQRRLNAKAKKAGVAPVQLPAMVVPHSTAPVRTGAGSVSMSLVWVGEVENDELVPAAYLMVDQKKVDAAVKAGIRIIPGVRIFEKPKNTGRTA